MAYLPESFAPEPNFEDEPFWDFCRKQELRFQRCVDCEMARHPPSPICPACHSTQSYWASAPDEGTIFTYTIIHHPADNRIGASIPYVVALVKFDGFDEVKLVTNIVSDGPVAIGQSVKLVWDAVDGDMYLPRFAAVDT